jgi:hypothetical protein
MKRLMALLGQRMGRNDYLDLYSDVMEDETATAGSWKTKDG